MFFYLSKIFWFIFAPSNLLLILTLLGACAFFLRSYRAAKVLIAISALSFFVMGFVPLYAWLMRPLEDRFPIPDLTGKSVSGIIVLGGAVDQMATAARGPVQLNEAGSRMTESVALARRFPNARLVFTGGSARLLGITATEAETAKQFYLAMGIELQRLLLEDRSRNTHENAVFTRRLVQPKPGETWLQVTSAWHMPRSVGIFRKAGFPVLAYPVDYRTRGVTRDYWSPLREVSLGLRLTDTGVREWIGLISYRLTGKTDALFPAPEPAGK